ncbi:hypothetical protein [Pseudoalteromonas sp. OOF1S-7]|uniref:hypothetical protein n=1 Tax=Pseudoalteromonas sp. OOF1S-7 TaxID=2917757 RepID=UPI001EF5271D|nr:hypothetical protein [Pseudoalteromonas sp. OOF1S-7]MCG7537129.1 hypothetical protein [Pseudoalteromonas sp. OOF1S-7]
MYTVLYGINTNTSVCYDLVDAHKTKLIATTDGSGQFKGYQTLNLDALAEVNAQQSIEKIIICSMYVSEITTSLLEKGILLDVIYYYDLSCFEVRPVREVINADIKEHDILYAFYDLSSNLPTFDCVQFALLAELERVKRKKKFLQFIIVPDRSASQSYLGLSQYHDQHDLNWRITHIVEPVFSLIKSALTVSTLALREQATSLMAGVAEGQVFPSNFGAAGNSHAVRQIMLKPYVDAGYSLSLLAPHREAQRQVDTFFEKVVGDKKAVVITLREYAHQPQRNSDLASWERFLSQLDKEVYFPIIVRDTYTVADRLPDGLANYTTFPLAAIDIHFRVALYRRAFINMAKTNGAFYLCNFIPGCRSLTFIEVDDLNPTMSTETWVRSGYRPGEDAFLRDNADQKIIWGPDSYENIASSFARINK